MTMSVGTALIAVAATVAAVAVSAAVAVVVVRGGYELPIITALRIECRIATSPSRGKSDRGGMQRRRQEQRDGGRCHDGKSAAMGKEFAARCERVRFGRPVGRVRA